MFKMGMAGIMSNNLKRVLHWTGSTFGVLGVAFVVIKFSKYRHQIGFSTLSSASFLTLFALAGVYGVANLLLAFAWRDILKHFHLNTKPRWIIRTYGISQLAKYVPGNIFHLAGRQAIGMAASLPAWALAKSAIWELGLIALTATLFAFLIVPFFWGQVTFLIAMALFICSIITLVWFAFRWAGRWVASALSWYALFLTFSGVVFLMILSIVVPTSSVTAPLVIGVCGAYVVGWLAGLITPGAPAGVGVREFVLFTILQSVVAQGDLLAAIVLGRMVTIGGDLLFYFVAASMRSHVLAKS
jgi:uncharacterized membrane protein YbhN (UPF0104 family)